MRFDYRSMSVAAGLVLAGVAAAGLAGPRQVDRAVAVMRSLREDAAAKMTAAEIAAAERMAGAWRPSNPGLRL